MKKRILFLICYGISLAAFSQKDIAPLKGWTLRWADEFNYTGKPDTTKWGYDIGGHGWGNNELQYYTSDPSNAHVEKGNLYITAKKEKKDKNEYTSTRLVSKGKGDWLYVRIEIKAKLPKGRGTWPAIWMLPTDWAYGGWPASGEIDIMEHVGYMPDSIFGSVHTKSFNHVIHTQVTKGIFRKDLYTQFHVYAIEWDADHIDFYTDGVRYSTFKNTHKNSDEWPFDKPFHLLMNIAIGGGWGGQKGIDETIFPQSMVVDYVRVYSR